MLTVDRFQKKFFNSTLFFQKVEQITVKNTVFYIGSCKKSHKKPDLANNRPDNFRTRKIEVLKRKFDERNVLLTKMTH